LADIYCDSIKSARTKEGQNVFHLLVPHCGSNSHKMILGYVLGMRQMHSLVTTADNSGTTPLHSAALNGNQEALIAFLLDVPLRTDQLMSVDQEGNTFLHFLVRHQASTLTDTVSIIQAKGKLSLF